MLLDTARDGGCSANSCPHHVSPDRENRDPGDGPGAAEESDALRLQRNPSHSLWQQRTTWGTNRTKKPQNPHPPSLSSLIRAEISQAKFPLTS